MKLTAILEQIARALVLSPRKSVTHLEEMDLNREAVERARRAVDLWNERTRENWRRDGVARSG